MSTRKTIVILGLLSCICATIVVSQEFPGPKPAKTVSVTSFGTDNVIGHLGHPLGTVVRVTGISIDGDETRIKENAGKTLLKIQSVDGKPLEPSFVVAFFRAGKNFQAPRPGDAFDYYVHEWGTFDGVVTAPKELGIDKPIVANDGFH